MESRTCHCHCRGGPPLAGYPPCDGWLGRSAFALTKRTCLCHSLFICPSLYRTVDVAFLAKSESAKLLSLEMDDDIGLHQIWSQTCAHAFVWCICRPELKPVEKDSEVVLKFPDAEKLSPPILQLDEVNFHYVPDQPVFTSVCVNANMESRVCIVSK